MSLMLIVLHKVTQRLQQQLQVKADSPVKTKVVRLNGIIQDQLSAKNHLTAVVAKGKKDSTQSSNCGNLGTIGNLPKTPKIDGEDSDSMASTSRECTTSGV